MRFSTAQKLLFLFVFLLLLFVIIGNLYIRQKKGQQTTSSSQKFVLPVKNYEKIVEKDGYLLFYLRPETPIYPSFTGKVKTGEVAEPERYKRIAILSPDGYRLNYFFKGEVAVRTGGIVTTKSDLKIGTTSSLQSEFIENFENANLVLSLEENDQRKPLQINVFLTR